MESAQDAPQNFHLEPTASMDMPTASIASGFCQSLPKKGKASPWGSDEIKVKAWLAAKIQKWGCLPPACYIKELLTEALGDHMLPVGTNFEQLRQACRVLAKKPWVNNPLYANIAIEEPWCGDAICRMYCMSSMYENMQIYMCEAAMTTLCQHF